MTTTPDYAGLIPQNVMDAARKEWMRVAEERGNWDAALAAALRVSHRTLLESNAALERERDRLQAIADQRFGAILQIATRAGGAEAERDRLARYLSNLLARIHRDGGHYEQQHGTEKAVADADELVARSLVKGGVDG